jgi:ubiquinone/menaquinone biosynthesis C-methylase UbiE
VVWALMDALPPGPALDTARGTGRHARHLTDLGHEVVGIDLTPEMLEHARRAVPMRCSSRQTHATSRPRTGSFR